MKTNQNDVSICELQHEINNIKDQKAGDNSKPRQVGHNKPVRTHPFLKNFNSQIGGLIDK